MLVHRMAIERLRRGQSNTGGRAPTVDRQAPVTANTEDVELMSRSDTQYAQTKS
jgi:hypothetical protein